MKNIVDDLAELNYKQYKNWISTTLKICEGFQTGKYIIPDSYIAMWKKQFKISYQDLPENEKKICKDEANKFIWILKKWINKTFKGDN